MNCSPNSVPCRFAGLLNTLKIDQINDSEVILFKWILYIFIALVIIVTVLHGFVTVYSEDKN